MATRRKSPPSTDVSRPARPRAVGYRFACACPAATGGLVVVAVRFDEDAPEQGDALVARLVPGRIEPVGRVDGIVRAVVNLAAGPAVLVDDGRLLIRSNDERWDVLRRDVVDVVPHGQGAVAVDAAGDVFVVDAAGTAGPTLGRIDGARRVASDGVRVVVAAPESVVTPEGRAVLDVSGHALAVTGTRVAVGDDRGVTLLVAGATHRLNVPHGAHSLAFLGPRLFVGSRASGLFVVDDEGLRSLRPSLRARTLQAAGDELIVASDLFVAWGDGLDLATRDLGGFVRLLDRSD
jgi:hypothetical protein